MNELTWQEKEQLKQEWLKSLKAGDEVAVVRRGWDGVSADFVKICKVTATQIVTDKNRYRKNTGRLVGNHFSSIWLDMPTDELKKQVADIKELGQLRYEVEKINWRNQPVEILRKVKEILK